MRMVCFLQYLQLLEAIEHGRIEFACQGSITQTPAIMRQLNKDDVIHVKEILATTFFIGLKLQKTTEQRTK